MPNVSVTLPDIEQSVHRPVIKEIVSQVQEITKITKDAKVFFSGDSQYMASAGSTVDNPDRTALTNTQRILFVEVEEAYDNETLGSTAVSRIEYAPVFLDRDLEVAITPVYATAAITINFRYRTHSKTEAQRWLADMRMHVSMLRDINLHSVSYHYPIPNVICDLLAHIYDKREAQAGYGQSLGDYIREHSSTRLTVVGDLVGKNTQLAVSETQARIQGLYGFDGMPDKPEREDQGGVWTVTLSYKFSYEKPIGCHVKYPVMVHNQLLDSKYISETQNTQDRDRESRYFSLSGGAFSAFDMTTVMTSIFDGEPEVRVPSYDDFYTKNITGGTGTLGWFLCEVDPSDPTLLLNLRELGDYCIDSDILSFIQSREIPYICDLHKSFFHLQLYRGPYLASNGTLYCDPELNIRSRVELSPRTIHRVRLSMVTDIHVLAQRALMRLENQPAAMVKIISAINGLIRSSTTFQKLADQPVIHEYQLTHLYALLTKFSLGAPWEDIYPMRDGFVAGILDTIPREVIQAYTQYRQSLKTVMISSVVALRQ